MSRLCMIGARGGSKGVPNKNSRLLMGKPLIAYTLEQAQASQMFDEIAVSSDSDEILAIAKQYGATILVKRPEELATDQAAKVPVMQHCLQTVKSMTNMIFHTIVDLDATAPLRNVEDIIQSIQQFESHPHASNLITGMNARRNPYFNLVEQSLTTEYVYLSKELPHSIVRRQDAPKCYDMNASIYIWTEESLMNNKGVIQDKTILYEMPEERSIDIDSPLDWEFVQFLMERRNG